MTTFMEFLGHGMAGTRTCLQAFATDAAPASIYVKDAKGYDRWIEQHDHHAQVYVSINPIMKGAGKFPKDADVAFWCNEYIDLDGEKPSKDLKGYNATDEELERLKPFVEKINNWLTEHKFKTGYCDMTGNGYRWILPVPPLMLVGKDLSVLAAKKKAFKERIAKDCGIVPGSGAAIDSVFDLKRITGVPGTENTKKETPDRPCRTREPFRGCERDEDQDLRDYIMLMETEAPASQPAAERTKSGTLAELMKKDKKLRQLVNGDTCDHGSRSEAELALACKLVIAGFGDVEIGDILVDVHGSKAAEKRAGGIEDYITKTVAKAVEFVASKSPKVVKNVAVEGQYEILNYEQFRKLTERYPYVQAQQLANIGDNPVYEIRGDDFIELAVDLEIIKPYVGDDGSAIIVINPVQLQSFIEKVEVRKDGADTMYYVDIRGEKIEFGVKELMDVPMWRDKLIQCNMVLSFDLKKHSVRDVWSMMVADILNRAKITWSEDMSGDDLYASVVMNEIQKLVEVDNRDAFKLNPVSFLKEDGAMLVKTDTIREIIDRKKIPYELTKMRYILRGYLVSNTKQLTIKKAHISVWSFEDGEE